MYSLRKSHQVMKTSYKWYKQKGSQLSPNQLVIFESHLQALDQAIVNQNQGEADRYAHLLEEFCQAHFKKSAWQYFVEVGTAVIFALLIATVVRQMWFEPYEIPTGSMRPTFEELDRLTVTKTAFGLNIPLLTKHFYFDPKLVQRGGIVIWSGEGVAHLDPESTFMGIFPYSKRYIKRCLGKAGDTLYFYGGKIYGFDREGHDLSELLNNPWMAKLEHIPFMRFEGRVSQSRGPNLDRPSEVIFHQMNQSIGRLIYQNERAKGEIFNGQAWVTDQPEAQRYPHNTLQTYSDFWGMRNFALVRLLSKKQVQNLTPYPVNDKEEGILYLEMRHTPHLMTLESGTTTLTSYATLLPLKEQHIKAIMENMYTARFVVKNGRAQRYRQEGQQPFTTADPLFPGVEDGTYELYYGKAYQIDWSGIATLLPPEHPLYSQKPSHVQKLFNIGMEMSNDFLPQPRNQFNYPSRYAYFREGDLYLLGAPIVKKDEPMLKEFLKTELKRESDSTSSTPYVAFRDYGPPLTAKGELDKEFIETFGFKVPEGKYLMLGDNHAMSKDSRYFGPVPQANIQGAPSLIIWPPGERWGFPNQKPYPFITLPRLIVWGTVLLIGLLWYLLSRRRLKRPIFKRLYAQGNP